MFLLFGNSGGWWDQTEGSFEKAMKNWKAGNGMEGGYGEVRKPRGRGGGGGGGGGTPALPPDSFFPSVNHSPLADRRRVSPSVLD